MPAFVLDASLTLAWCFDDEATPDTVAAQRQFEDDSALTSHLWLLEIANVLLVAQRQGRTTEANAQRSIQLLHRLPVQVVPLSFDEVFTGVLPLARQYQLSAYDASYLYLAINRALPLAALDKRLRAAARAAGVPLIPETL